MLILIQSFIHWFTLRSLNCNILDIQRDREEPVLVLFLYSYSKLNSISVNTSELSLSTISLLVTALIKL